MSQHKAPHRNWMPAPDKLTLYDGVTFPEPPNLFDRYENRATPAAQQEMEIDRHMTLMYDLKLVPEGVKPDDPDYKSFLVEYGRMTPEQKRVWDAAYAQRNAAFFKAAPKGADLVRWKYQRYMQDYLRCIASVDDAVGRVLRYLDATGLSSNTIVVYASDQGFFLGEHGWFDKRWIYEESLRTPCLVRWPGVIAPGSASDALTSNLDFAETMLDAAGLARAGGHAGAVAGAAASRRGAGRLADVVLLPLLREDDAPCRAAPRRADRHATRSRTTTRRTSGSCSIFRRTRGRCGACTRTRPTRPPWRN